MPTKVDTETGWSKGLPAKSGWYFMRNEGEGVFAEGMIVWVGHNSSGVRHEGEFMYAPHPWLKRREFLGPVLHSDFERLIRLRKAAKVALEWMDWWLDSELCECDGYGHVCGKTERKREADALREVLVPTEGESNA